MRASNCALITTMQTHFELVNSQHRQSTILLNTNFKETRPHSENHRRCRRRSNIHTTFKHAPLALRTGQTKYVTQQNGDADINAIYLIIRIDATEPYCYAWTRQIKTMRTVIDAASTVLENILSYSCIPLQLLNLTVCYRPNSLPRARASCSLDLLTTN